MIRSLDPSAERFLLDLTRIQNNIERASQQISTGLKVTAPSDAPDQISDILQLFANIERSVQIRSNLERFKTETKSAENALETAINIIERARVLGSQGAGTYQTAETRRILAGEVQALFEQMVNTSRTMVGNRYIFSGDEDRSPAYQLNLGDPLGVDRLLQSASTRLAQHPSGVTFPLAKSAQEIFDMRNPDDTPAVENAFAALNGLRTALENNDQDGIETALQSLRAVGDHLNRMLSFYGTVENKLNEAMDFASKQELQFKEELGVRRDADLTTAITELQRFRTLEDAAYAARANRPQTSLFDFLK